MNPWLFRSLVIAGLALSPVVVQAGVDCNYEFAGARIDFGTISGASRSQADVTATIQVTCTRVLEHAPLNQRVCLSMPAGTGSAAVADRRMVSGGHFMQYQIYIDAARAVVWGALGESAAPRSVDFTHLALRVPQTQTVTVYSRVFGGQAGKAVGTYQSMLSPVVARREGYIVGSPPGCQSVTANAQTLSPLAVQLGIETDCTVDANPLDFGAVSALTGHAATTNLAVTCTLDGPYSIALDGGSVTGDINARQMILGAGPATIDYQLYQDAAQTQVWGDTPGTTVDETGTGVPESIPVFGWVPPQGATQPGTYQDTVTVTVTF